MRIFNRQEDMFVFKKINILLDKIIAFTYNKMENFIRGRY